MLAIKVACGKGPYVNVRHSPTFMTISFVVGQHAVYAMSVILVTGSYDLEIRFWEAWNGICSRTIARQGESGVSL